MRKLVLLGLVLVLAQNGFSQSGPKDPTSRIIDNLGKIESLYFKNLTPQERQEAVRLLNETRSLVVGNPAPPDRSGGFSERNILGDESFQSLYDSVKNEPVEDSKSKLILAIGKNGKLTCAQLSQLVALYTFDSSRESLIRSLADNIFDPVNIGIVLKYFDSSITRDKLAEFFRNR
jgi:hypothetical protein